MEKFDPKKSLELHDRLLNEDPTAAAEIAELLLPHLIYRLRIKFEPIDNPHLLEESAHIALMDYIRRPERYDPKRSNLLTYIGMAAFNDSLNLIRSEKRHGNVIPIQEYVANEDSDREYTVEIADEFDLEASVISRIITDERLQSWVPDETDLKVIFLLMENVRETDAYASLLGITHLSIDEQEKTVKRHKDRIKKLLKRRLQAIEMDDHD